MKTKLPLLLLSFLGFLMLNTAVSTSTAAPGTGRVSPEAEDTSSISRNLQLPLTYRDYGIGFGDVPVVHGLRLNYRDRHLQRVNGINITLAQPDDEIESRVRGWAIGLPATGGGSIRGISTALLGITASESISGIQIAGIGIAAGGPISGITIAGLGMGSGGALTGINIAGLGFGADGSVQGINFGGLGFGSSGDIRGLNLATLGFGADGNIQGVSFALMGFGSNGSISGINIAGLGFGVSDDIRGLSIAGLGAGAGNDIRGLHIAGLGFGSQNFTGTTISLMAEGSGTAKGLFVAPLRFNMKEEGSLHGVSISGYNHIGGAQHGLTIGLINIAGHLNGIQLGLLNYAGNNPAGLRLLPVANANL